MFNLNNNSVSESDKIDISTSPGVSVTQDTVNDVWGPVLEGLIKLYGNRVDSNQLNGDRNQLARIVLIERLKNRELDELIRDEIFDVLVKSDDDIVKYVLG